MSTPFGKVGQVIAADGSMSPIRLDKTGAVVVVPTHGSYGESVSRSRVFIASNAVAGVAPGTALSTTPPFALWNPTNSGVNLVVLIASMGYISGTLGGGSVVYAQVVGQVLAPTTGTELIPVNAYLNGQRGLGRAYTGSTVVATPILIKPAFVVGAALATTAVFPAQVKDYVDGEIIVPPGSVLVLQEVGAGGSSPLAVFSVTWEELPIT